MNRDELKKTIDRCLPRILESALDTRDPFTGIFKAAANILSRQPFWEGECFSCSGFGFVESALVELAASSIAALAQTRWMVGEGFALSEDSIDFCKRSQTEAIDNIIQERMEHDICEGDAEL